MDINDMNNINDFQDIKPLEATPASPSDVTVAIKVEQGEAKPEVVMPHNDHDYTYTIMDVGAKAEPGSAWIEEDAPPKVLSF